MLPVKTITNAPKEEPIVHVNVGGHTIQLLVDADATFSCIGKDGQSLPLSGKNITTQGFSGIIQNVPLTKQLTSLWAH